LIPIKDNIPVDRFPLVTVTLILANVVVYVVAALHGGSLIAGPDAHELARYGVAAHDLGSGRLISAMFLHASIVQLAGNLMFLWIFGNNVEDSTGPLRFLALYLIGGVAAFALQAAVDSHLTVGGSGAVAAVLGGYLVLYPRARVLTLSLIPLFFTVVEIPVLAMLALWVLMQAAFGVAGLTDPLAGADAIACISYLGGLIVGLAAITPLATRRKPMPPTAAAYR
jgi:membrane associated rhomboid family serine protease